MRSLRLGTLLLATSVLAGLFASPVDAQTLNGGFFGEVKGDNKFECPMGSFLVGVVLNQTDRIIGMRFVCAKAVTGPQWASVDASGVQPSTFGNVASGATNRITNSTCPYGFFLIGLRGTVGEYRGGRTFGIAQPLPPDLLADLALVCRGPSGAIFAFNDGRLIEADDNNLSPIGKCV